MRLYAAFVLLYRFLVAVVVSGFSTAWSILRPAPQMQPGFIRMAFGDLDERGAVLLSGLTCLTPGTTVVDIDYDRRELLVHLLDTREAAATVRQILDEFQAPLSTLFPRGDRP